MMTRHVSGESVPAAGVKPGQGLAPPRLSLPFCSLVIFPSPPGASHLFPLLPPTPWLSLAPYRPCPTHLHIGGAGHMRQ